MDNFLQSEALKVLSDNALVVRTVTYALLSALLMYLSMHRSGTKLLFRCLSLFFTQTLLVTTSAVWFPAWETLFRAILAPVLIVSVWASIRLLRTPGAR